MIMTNFLQKRRSVRSFKSKRVSSSDIETIRKYMEEIESNESSVTYVLYENGSIISDALDGKAGYNGVMIKSPHYIGIITEKDDIKAQLDTGYYLEKLNTKIVDMDIDTCWLTVDEVDEKTMQATFGEIGSGIKYLIAFGYGTSKKLFEVANVSSRKELSSIVFYKYIENKISQEDLENLGLVDVFSSIRFAPSHKNSQPWRFVVDDGFVDLYMDKNSENKRSLVDMGVVMFYFEEMARGLNVVGKWEVELHDEGQFLKVGKFNL